MDRAKKTDGVKVRVATQPLGGAQIALQVLDRLRKEIISGGIAPGKSLSEAEYATRYGVSRQPVREAFIRLSADGLLDVQPQRGTFVKKVSLRAVADARFVRESVELAVVSEACIRATPADVAMLTQIVTSQRELCELEQEGAATVTRLDDGLQRAMAAGFLALDEAFHRALAKVAGHESAWDFVDRIKTQMDRVRYLSYPSATPTVRLVEQHAEILAALARKDCAAAQAAIRAHLSEVISALPAVRERFPALFED